MFMLTSSLKYENHIRTFIDIENWMRFAMVLSSYVKSNKNPLNMYISIPSNLLFSYFFTLGSVDYDFKNPSKTELLEYLLHLKKGQRILYKVQDSWIAHSVIEVGKIPNSDKRAIVVRDRLNAINYIPESRWFDYVRIHEDEITVVRNIRKVNGVENLVDNNKLKKIYSEDNLNILMMQNTPKTYLYVSRKEWKDNLSIIELEINEEPIQLNELLFDGSEGTYKNYSFIEQNTSSSIPNDSTVIFVGSSRALRKMDHFKKQKCVFIVDQHDSNEKFEDLQFKIEQDFLMERAQSLNKQIIEYMDNNKVQIPKGVEIFAWV